MPAVLTIVKTCTIFMNAAKKKNKKTKKKQKKSKQNPGVKTLMLTRALHYRVQFSL